jgi:phosphatidylglycerophosphate synthase
MENRRPVASRRVSAFQNVAKLLVRWGISPNQVSVASSVFALLGGWALSQISRSDGMIFYEFILLAFAGIQMRLLCNLFDGLMAVEGGLKTPAGDLYNEIPDRFSDLFLIVGASYSIPFSWGCELGWAAAFFACMTAYVRTLGASLLLGHDFEGPMAKPHRMAILNLTLAAAFIEKYLESEVRWSFMVGVGLIFIGSLWTTFRRAVRAGRKLSMSSSISNQK